MIRPFFYLLLLPFCLSVPGAARTLEELEVAFEVKVLKLRKEHQESVGKLEKSYLKALTAAQTELQNEARLDDVLEVLAEIKKLEKSQWPLPKLSDSAPPELERLRKLYEKSRVETELKHAEDLVETADKMSELLEAQMKALTKAGDIAQAEKARNELEALDERAEISQARKLIARVRLNRDAPVAMHIRRSGDDLEVLVRYDKRGEVSLDSPVENVVELTGDRGQKGDTSATVLGEFVGAMGYQVDSYVAYESDMKKIIPPMRAVSFELEPDFEYEDRRAMRILMPEKAPNPRVEWPLVLASKASSSRVKIDFQYLIPSDNEKLKAFSFHWGLAAPINDKVLDTTGRWVAESLEAESMNEHETLRLYIDKLAGSRKTFNGGNEAIYLDRLKVTFLSFAAHVVARYEDGKVVGDPVTDASAQEAVVHAGKLLPSLKN